MYISVNNQNIYYQKVGKGKDLILLHGWGQDVSTWWGVVELLKDDFTLWLIDLPGFGRSDVPKTAFSNKDYAQVVQGFIEKLNLKQPSLVGHSLGGRVAIKLSSSQGQIDKLILEDAAGIKPKQDYLKPFFYVCAKVVKNILPNWFNLRDGIRQRFYQSLESDYLKAGQMTETLTNLLREDLTIDLAKIKNETLIIWGEKDRTRGASVADGKQMYRLIEDSRIEIIENVGHFPHLENPIRFAYYVKDFLT